MWLHLYRHVDPKKAREDAIFCVIINAVAVAAAHPTGNGRIRAASVSSGGCRPSRMASMMWSGQKSRSVRRVSL
jgi:hypothetical protein